jgi:hypothetical protein
MDIIFLKNKILELKIKIYEEESLYRFETISDMQSFI